MSNRSLLACDRELLRRKTESLQGELSDYWQFFLRRCRRHPAAHPVDLAIAHLCTGERDDLRLFAQQFRQFTASLPSRDWTNQGQFHAWTNALPLTRWLLAYDLVADDPEFDQSFREQAARAWLGYADRIVWPVVRSRVQTGDNQFFAICLASAVIGHVFGCSRHSSALGRELLADARRRLDDAVGQMPPGGYSGEGHYHNQVVATLATLYSACAPALFGGEVFERRLPPHGVSPRDILEVDFHTILPGGLLPPWDASFFHRLHVKMNLVYLARTTGNLGFLRPLRRFRLFEGDPRPGWGRDDDAWTWFWWPDGVGRLEQIPEEPPASWARQHVAFGLVEPDARTALFQNFDTSERRTSPAASRAQSDPNNLVLVGHGVPLLLDGGYAGFDEGQTATPAARRGRVGVTGFGFHNCLFFDGEMAAGAPQTTAGRLTCFFRSPVLSLGEADVTAHYADYAVEQVRRRTLQLGGGLYVVADQVRAARPPAITWTLWTRPGARREGDRFVVETPEQVRLTLLPPPGEPEPVRHVPGVGEILERAASRIAVRTGGDAQRLLSVLEVAPRATTVLDITDGWEIAVDAGGQAAAGRWQAREAAWPAAGTIDCRRGAGVQLPALPPHPLPQRFIWDYMDQRQVAPVGRYDVVDFEHAVWLRRRVVVPAAAAGKRLFLRIERPPWYFRLYVDGREQPGLGADHPTRLGDSHHMAPGVIELTPSAAAGQTFALALAIAAPYATTALGVVELCAECEPAPLACQPAGELLRIAAGGRELAVLPINPGNRVMRNGDEATDAETAVLRRSDGDRLDAWAAVRAARLDAGEERLLHCRQGRVSAAYEPGGLTVAEVGREAVCEFNLPEGRVVVRGGAVWEGLAVLSRPLIVRTPAGEGLPAPQWSQPATCVRQGEDWVCRLTPAVDTAAPLSRLQAADAHGRVEAACALACAAGAEVESALTQALRDRCWTVRCAAARSLGRRLARAAVGPLLDVLAAEQARDVYGGITDQDAFPQWPGGSNGDPLTEFGRLPVAVRPEVEPGAPADFLNRFRLKQAVIEALGLIGDPRAAPLLVALLEPGEGPGGLGMTGGDFYPVRKAAVEALGRIGSPAAASVLRRLAESEVEVNTRLAAQQGASGI